MAVGSTVSKITGVADYNDANSKCRIRDIAFDTGTYLTGGITVTAASLGLKTIDMVRFGTQIATNGTAGATGNWIGVRYAANRQSVIFQEYESAATGLAALEKTNAEANAANFTFRVEFVSFA